MTRGLRLRIKISRDFLPLPEISGLCTEIEKTAVFCMAYLSMSRRYAAERTVNGMRNLTFDQAWIQGLGYERD